MASLNDKQRPSQWLLNKFIHALDIILKCSFHFASSKRGFSITDANQNKKAAYHFHTSLQWAELT